MRHEIIIATNVWLVVLYCTHQFIDYGKKTKTFPCRKLSMLNGSCENRLCAWAPRVRQGSYRI